MKYSIGEFAKLIGVTVDTVRLYEKQGIITPEKDEKNNYRYFDDLDVRDILTSRWYRSLGLPLKTTTELIQHASYEDVENKISERYMALEAEIKSKQALLQQIASFKNDFLHLKDMVGVVYEKKLGTLYRLKQTNQNALISDASTSNIQKMMDALPYTLYTLCINQSALERSMTSPAVNAYPFDWGVGIFSEDFHHTQIESTHDFDAFDLSNCLSTVVCSSNDDIIHPDALSPLFKTLQSKKLKIDGDLIGRLIFREKSIEHTYAYIEICIPVKKISSQS